MSTGNKVVLDTHIWIWWIDQDECLPKKLAEIIEDPDVGIFISAVSIYEMTYGVQRGRIKLSRPTDDWIKRATIGVDIGVMAVTETIAHRAGQLPLHHGDPLDRMIIASALESQSRLASADSKFPNYQELAGSLIPL